MRKPGSYIKGKKGKEIIPNPDCPAMTERAELEKKRKAEEERKAREDKKEDNSNAKG